MTLSKGIQKAYLGRQLKRMPKMYERVRQLIAKGEYPPLVGDQFLVSLRRYEQELRDELEKLSSNEEG